MTSVLEGVRVLVVEDEYFVAILIEEILESAGCIVTGPIDFGKHSTLRTMTTATLRCSM